MDQLKKIHFNGTAVAVRGNDIDTDRIIPARFLKCITFNDVGAHVFEDDRKLAAQAGRVHPFDEQACQGASVLLVNKNFGCGSSREHAAQSLKRWNKGITCVVGESFAEIFFSNCLAIGIPCVTVSESDIASLMVAAESDVARRFSINLERKEVTCGDLRVKATIPEGACRQLLEGRWDATFDLLEGKPLVMEKAQALPYFCGWR